MINNLKEIYPEDFTDEMKTQYDLLLRQAKILYSEAEEWTLKLAIIAYIRQGDGERPKISQEEIEEYKSKYNTQTTEYKTEVDVGLLEVKEDACNWLGTSILNSNINENIILSIDRNENIQNQQTESVIS